MIIHDKPFFLNKNRFRIKEHIQFLQQFFNQHSDNAKSTKPCTFSAFFCRRCKTVDEKRGKTDLLQLQHLEKHSFLLGRKMLF